MNKITTCQGWRLKSDHKLSSVAVKWGGVRILIILSVLRLHSRHDKCNEEGIGAEEMSLKYESYSIEGPGEEHGTCGSTADKEKAELGSPAQGRAAGPAALLWLWFVDPPNGSSQGTVTRWQHSDADLKSLLFTVCDSRGGWIWSKEKLVGKHWGERRKR